MHVLGHAVAHARLRGSRVSRLHTDAVREVDALRRGEGLPSALGKCSTVGAVDGNRTHPVVPAIIVKIDATLCLDAVVPGLAIQDQFTRFDESVVVVQNHGVAVRDHDGADLVVNQVSPLNVVQIIESGQLWIDRRV